MSIMLIKGAVKGFSGSKGEGIFRPTGGPLCELIRDPGRGFKILRVGQAERLTKTG